MGLGGGRRIVGNGVRARQHSSSPPTPTASLFFSLSFFFLLLFICRMHEIQMGGRPAPLSLSLFPVIHRWKTRTAGHLRRHTYIHQEACAAVILIEDHSKKCGARRRIPRTTKRSIHTSWQCVYEVDCERHGASLWLSLYFICLNACRTTAIKSSYFAFERRSK